MLLLRKYLSSELTFTRLTVHCLSHTQITRITLQTTRALCSSFSSRSDTLLASVPMLGSTALRYFLPISSRLKITDIHRSSPPRFEPRESAFAPALVRSDLSSLDNSSQSQLITSAQRLISSSLLSICLALLYVPSSSLQNQLY